ncbi:MAG: hypothetical protein OEV94_10490 [Deltaproteobacteria bacterium]|nr:hypothetical protein [Deltaproteobacteria bacterium]
MIELIPQTQADREGLNPMLVQSVSPYLNPAHVLSPPRDWLEAMVQGDIPWPLFRLRYKNMLWKRFRRDPAPFYRILEASEGHRKLYLSCHCLTSVCHREIARDFLTLLRASPDYRRWREERPSLWALPFHPAGLVEHPMARA